MKSARARLLGVAVVAALAVAACGSDDDEPAATGSPADAAEPQPASDDEMVDPDGTRDDVDCSAEGLGSDDELEFGVGHYVVDGELGAVCFGEDSETLTASWDLLATITPPLQLTDLGLFGGFASREGGDEVTLAFVNALDDFGTLFQMSVNLDAADDDPDELQLTMAHEFSHVFTGTESQLDRTDEAIDNCETYYNGEGCYLADALMWQWIQEFWGGGLIEEVDPEADATGDEGQERCDTNAGFFGAYAASNPEEDFAESFSAMVFRVEAATPEQQARIDWLAAQPGLVEFRARAVAAGLGPLSNGFDPCGTAA